MKLVRKNSRAALTIVELLVVVVVVVLLVTLWMDGSPRALSKAPGIACVNSLKQVALSFRLWSQDNNDKYPMQVSVTNGGAMEPAAEGNPVPIFQIMSNELNTPKILVCPADVERNYATNFEEDFRRANISYFVNLDATNDSLQTFLCGDRNITNGYPISLGILEVTTNQVVGWKQEAEPSEWRKLWKRFVHDRTISGHQGYGNIALVDGSAQRLNNSGLNQTLQNCVVATNRLIIP